VCPQRSQGHPGAVGDRAVNRWRTGRKLGRTVYIEGDDGNPFHDHFVGLMDTADLAEFVVKCVNICLDAADAKAQQLNTGG
jgi:hypothetical protein